MTDVTHILNAIEQGDAKAADELLPAVYEELHRLATQKMLREQPALTTCPYCKPREFHILPLSVMIPLLAPGHCRSLHRSVIPAIKTQRPSDFPLRPPAPVYSTVV